jgi:hypothetical protein
MERSLCAIADMSGVSLKEGKVFFSEKRSKQLLIFYSLPRSEGQQT